MMMMMIDYQSWRNRNFSPSNVDRNEHHALGLRDSLPCHLLSMDSLLCLFIRGRSLDIRNITPWITILLESRPRGILFPHFATFNGPITLVWVSKISGGSRYRGWRDTICQRAIWVRLGGISEEFSLLGLVVFDMSTIGPVWWWAERRSASQISSALFTSTYTPLN